MAESKRFPLSLLPRLAGFGVLIFIVWMLFSTLFRPLVSSSATRAILDAPAILLTTPIDGAVSAMTLQPGDTFVSGQTIASVHNPRADEQTLIELQTRRLVLQEQISTLNSQAEHDRLYLEADRKTLKQYEAAFHDRQVIEQKALQAQSSAAQVALDEARATVTRNEGLLHEGAISEAVVIASRARLATLEGSAESTRSRLSIKTADLSAAHQQVFPDPDQLRLFDLRAQITALELNTTNQQHNLTSLQQQMGELDALINREQSKVAMRSNYVVQAHSAGTVQDVVAPQGTLVRAGSTVLRASDCNQAYVVAVLPERVASHVSRDAELRVDVRGLKGPLTARVVQLLSNTGDLQNNSYTVPFPYAEPNSVYAVGRFEQNLTDAQKAAICAPGRWVDATVADL